MMDPDYYEDEYAADPDEDQFTALTEDEDLFYDTYDRIIEESEFDPAYDFERSAPGELDELEFGMAFAIAEGFIRDEERELLDENTDKENWEEAMRLNPVNRGTRVNLRPFEQYIDDICKGKRSLFE